MPPLKSINILNVDRDVFFYIYFVDKIKTTATVSCINNEC